MTSPPDPAPPTPRARVPLQVLVVDDDDVDREFVRRTAFAMLAWGAVHLKKEPDSTFEGYLPLIEAHAGDDRNFVKKAVNWALRQIGKRSPALHGPAVNLSEKLAASDDRTERWIGKDALKELTGPKIVERLRKPS